MTDNTKGERWITAIIAALTLLTTYGVYAMFRTFARNLYVNHAIWTLIFVAICAWLAINVWLLRIGLMYDWTKDVANDSNGWKAAHMVACVVLSLVPLGILSLLSRKVRLNILRNLLEELVDAHPEIIKFVFEDRAETIFSKSFDIPVTLLAALRQLYENWAMQHRINDPAGLAEKAETFLNEFLMDHRFRVIVGKSRFQNALTDGNELKSEQAEPAKPEPENQAPATSAVVAKPIAHEETPLPFKRASIFDATRGPATRKPAAKQVHVVSRKMTVKVVKKASTKEAPAKKK